MSPADRASFISSSLFYIHLTSYLNALNKNCSIVLSKRGESGHPCLVPNLG